MPDPVASLASTERRSRALRAGVLTSFVSRGFAAATPLFVIPIGLRYLGSSQYGAWATALSLTSLVLFADLGIGTGLMTRLGAIAGRLQDEVLSARRLIASGYAAVGALTALLLAVLLVSTRLLDWASLVGVSGDEATATVWIIVVTLGAFVLNMSASLIVRVQYGLGQQARSNVWQAAGSVGTLLATWGAAKTDPGPVAFVALSSAPLLVMAGLNTLSFFARHPVGRLLRPGLHDIDRDSALALMRLGSRFLAVSLLMTVATALDPVIVARTHNLSDVPTYAIPYRLFVFVSTISVMLTVPLWPFHAGAVASGDSAWVRRITRRMTLLGTALVGLASLSLAIAGPWLASWWLSPDFRVDLMLWSGMGTWVTVQAIAAPAFMVANGAEILQPQIVGYGLFALLVPLKWWVSSHLGFPLIPWIGAAGYCLFIWPACYLGYREALRRATWIGTQ